MTYQEVYDKRNIVEISKIYKSKDGRRLQKGVFNGEFDDLVIVHPTGGLLDDDINIIMGDISDVYDKVREGIVKNDAIDIIKLGEIIFKIVNEYFGDYSNIDSRKLIYKDESTYNKDTEISESGVTKVTDFKGKNAAMCLERSMLVQNILKLLGINSFFKMSMIRKNDQKEAHAYNLIEYNNNYYLIDAARPGLINGRVNAVLGEISYQAFQSQTCTVNELIDNNILALGIGVDYYNPLINNQYEVIYYPRSGSNSIDEIIEIRNIEINNQVKNIK